MSKKRLREKYSLTEKDKIIIFIGRLEKEKNLEFLIRSFKSVKNDISNAKLVLVGDGRERERLNPTVAEIGLKDVIFWSSIPHDRIPEILNCADVFALCSLYEGSPVIIKEALSCGLPIVSVDVGDVAELIESIDGCYISQRDEEDFARKLIRVLRQNKRVKAEGKLDRFGYEETGRITFNVYKSLATKPR